MSTESTTIKLPDAPGRADGTAAPHDGIVVIVIDGAGPDRT
jgi:hypothetical protein